jgi:hypothetical protein
MINKNLCIGSPLIIWIWYCLDRDVNLIYVRILKNPNLITEVSLLSLKVCYVSLIIIKQFVLCKGNWSVVTGKYMYRYNQFFNLMFELGHRMPVLSNRTDCNVCKYFMELKKVTKLFFYLCMSNKLCCIF